MEENDEKDKNPNPRTTSSFLSNLFFIWTIPLFLKGNKRDLGVDDLYKPMNAHRSHHLGDELEKAWMQQTTSERKSLMFALSKVFKVEICGYILLNFLLVFTPRLGQPILLMQILNFYIPGQTAISKNEVYIYVAGLILLISIASISGHQYNIGMQQLGMKLRVAVCSLLYRKTMKLGKFAENKTSSGQIINLLSNDVRLFDSVMLEFCLSLITPSELLADSILLYFLLGKTSLVGIAFLILFIPLQMYNAKLSAKYRFKIAKKTDTRILLMNELVSGIQVIKMYTWEKPFAKLVEAVRSLEVKQIRGSAYVNACLYSYNMFMSRTAQFLCILTFVLSGHTPVAQYVFVLTSFYNNLAKFLSVKFPDAISTFAKCRISCKRLETYLSLDEIHYSADINKKTKLDTSSPNGDNPKILVKLSKIAAKWGMNEKTDASLFNINLELREKDKVAIIGSVGSGKSSLINLILQELPIAQGNMSINGIISYAAQEPWLFKGSIRQNILFGQSMDLVKYQQVIKVCALQKDFEVLPFKDMTVVGEKGVMLSGGQKARINLARAVYREADIYLLDDPLSAVDTHVGKQLYEQCICSYLSEKCVLLITHQLQYLDSMDKVYIMEKGTFTQSGTYQELKNGRNSFVRLLSHNSENEEDVNQELERIDLKENEGKIGEDGKYHEEVKEHISTGALSNNVYKQYFMAGGRRYVPVLLMFLVTQICASAADYFITFWVNLEQSEQRKTKVINLTDKNLHTSIITPKQTFPEKTYNYFQLILTTELCIYIYSSIMCLLIVVTLTRSIAFLQYCLSVSTYLHNNMFEKIAKAPMRFFNTNPSGRILNRFSKDIGAIDEILPGVMMDTFEIGLTVIAVSAILVFINIWMIIPSVIILTLFYTYKHYYIKTSRSLKRVEGAVRSPVFSHMSASLQGLSTIRAFNLQEKLSEEFDNHQDLHSSAYFLFLVCNRAFGVLLDLNCLVYIAIVSVSTLVTASFGGNVGLAITQAMSLTGRLQWGVRQWGETENQMTSVERVLEYSNIDPEDDNNKESAEDWPQKGDIAFESVSMRYSAEEPAVLKNLCFTIQPKEKIGIVGRTGAGKSSLIAAIFRLTHFEGKISIDGINTSSISLRSLRPKISIIPQEPFLFSGTLRENLDPFEQFDDSIIWKALEKVELKDIFEQSPSGLNYQLSEGGANFSIGQRQLICLARALIRKNNIMIMDEATANIDSKTDELIQTTIRMNFEDCTVLTIAHRLHTIIDSDKVLVMEKGCVAEFDHPHILLSKNKGLFHSLVLETGREAHKLRKLAEENYNKQRYQ